jgi:hypothetical protein
VLCVFVSVCCACVACVSSMRAMYSVFYKYVQYVQYVREGSCPAGAESAQTTMWDACMHVWLGVKFDSGCVSNRSNVRRKEGRREVGLS